LKKKELRKSYKPDTRHACIYRKKLRSIAAYEPEKKAIFFIHDSQGGKEIGTVLVCRQWRVIYDASD